MHRIRPEYAKILGDYDSVEDLCNQKGLNLDEVYDYEDDDDEDDDDYNNDYDEDEDDDEDDEYYDD